MKTAFAPIADHVSKILILGTMPGETSLKLQQYYGHADNHFWKIMFKLFDTSFSKDYDLRKMLLLDNNVALWDVLQNCGGEGSADSSIKNEVHNDFDNFYNKHPKISKIYFTSLDAERFYDKYVKRKNHLEYFRLPSPSSANTWKTFDEKFNDWAR